MFKHVKLIIFISIGIIIIIALLFVIKFIYEQNFPKTEPVETAPIIESKIEEQVIETDEIVLLTEEAKEKNNIERMNLNFIESLGSYSNQSDFQNMVGLKVFATSKMQIWIDNFIKKEKEQNKLVNNYYGITTKALSIKENNFNTEKNQVNILINVQRQEAKESTLNFKVFYQDVLVKSIKEGEYWKIDEVEWVK